jgi:hypothetical protein
MPPALDLLALLALVSRRRGLPFDGHGPTALASLVRPDEVPRRRSLACPEYDRCLDTAFRRGWRSWTCERCPIFPLASTFRSIEIGSLGLERSPLVEA